MEDHCRPSNLQITSTVVDNVVAVNGERRKIYLRSMQVPDLNLLAALETLLTEQSVTEAAQKMGVSVSAMSRTLTRIRRLMGDPILVRAGMRLVPTPKAIELQRVWPRCSKRRADSSP